MNWKILLAIAGVAGVAALVAFGFEEEVEEDEETKKLKEHARDYFRVVGDCEAVEFTGTADQAEDFWANVGRPYIEAKMEEAMGTGVEHSPQTMTLYILEDLVPNCPWPPEGTVMDNPSQWMLHAAISEAVAGYLGEGPSFQDEEAPGASFDQPPQPQDDLDLGDS